MAQKASYQKALWIVIVFYLLNWLAYSLTLSYSMLYMENFDFWSEVGWQLLVKGLDQLIKAALSVPIWWLIFVLLRNKSLLQRLLLHLPLAVIFGFNFRIIFYQVCDWIGWGHLGGYGAIWDIYIPILFYFIQFGIFHAIEYHQQRMEVQERNAHLLRIQDQAELNALKAQLNPHFLYNVFNTINASIPKELESTREMIATLSDLFRFHLEASRSQKIRLGDELEFIEKYLLLEKARFGERLIWTFQVAEELLDISIPPLLLHPLVENAVKHGIGPSINGGELRLKVERQGTRLLFEVSDNGNGTDLLRLESEGTGLGNTRERLKRGYGEDLEIISSLGAGYTAKFGLKQ